MTEFHNKPRRPGFTRKGESLSLKRQEAISALKTLFGKLGFTAKRMRFVSCEDNPILKSYPVEGSSSHYLLFTSPNIKEKYSKAILPVDGWAPTNIPIKSVQAAAEEHMPGVILTTDHKLQIKGKKTLTIYGIQKLNFILTDRKARDVLKLGNIHYQALYEALKWAKRNNYERVKLIVDHEHQPFSHVYQQIADARGKKTLSPIIFNLSKLGA